MTAVDLGMLGQGKRDNDDDDDDDDDEEEEEETTTDDEYESGSRMGSKRRASTMDSDSDSEYLP